ncbi:MFS transporter [Glaciibacter superstes]|uniref:MFS transporter n=1 Tax=Glaciibacter superstes TaxID=501023 RepID=UPI0003B64936|nr:MFS transporter [Glaciibacter superstes]
MRTPPEGTTAGWLWPLVVSAALSQTAINLARPVITYEALAQDADAFVVGVISAAFAVTPVILTLTIGRIAARAKFLSPLLLVGVVAIAVGCAVLPLANTLVLIGLGSAVLGIGQMAFTIAGQSSVARYARGRDIDKGFGWFTAAFSVGQLIGPVLAGLVLGHDVVINSAGILQAFQIAGVVALLAVVPLLLVRRGFSRALRAAPVPAESKTATVDESAWAILRRPGIGVNMLASIALLATTEVLIAFLPLLGAEHRIAPSMIGLMLGVRAMASILSRAFTGTLVDRLGRGVLVGSSLVVAAASFIVLPFVVDWIWIALVVLTIGGFFLGLGQPITMTLISQSVSAGARSSALALRQLGNRFGQLLIPLGAGLVVAPLGAGGALWLSGGLLAAAAVARLRRTRGR